MPDSSNIRNDTGACQYSDGCLLISFHIFEVMQYLSIGQHIIQGIKQTSYLEWVGAVTTIACVYLAARQNIWNWLAGIIAVIAYMVVFFESGLFGDAYLQIYFLGTGI